MSNKKGNPDKFAWSEGQVTFTPPPKKDAQINPKVNDQKTNGNK